MDDNLHIRLGLSLVRATQEKIPENEIFYACKTFQLNSLMTALEGFRSLRNHITT